MIQIYGRSFSTTWGSEDAGVWEKVLFSFPPIIIQESINYLITGNHEFDKFPPNPIQFRKICDNLKREKDREIERERERKYLPRTKQKLDGICETCGGAGRTLKHEGLPNKVLCYNDYMKYNGINLPTREEIEKKYPIDTDNDIINKYNELRREGMLDDMPRRRFEDGGR